jgi:hypothetical protein
MHNYDNVMAEIATLVAVDGWMARVKQECADADAMAAYYLRARTPEDHECAKQGEHEGVC